MTDRFDIFRASPGAYQAMAALERYLVKDSGLPRPLLHLLKIRASIINGCTFCLDMHLKEARHDGLGGQWLDLVAAWHEAQVYSEAERALLAWTDAITLIAETKAPDADFAAMRAHFSEEQIAQLTLAIGAINVWNRLALASRKQHPIDAPARAA